MKTLNLIDALLYLILGIFIFFYARIYSSDHYTTSPAFFPQMIATLMIIFSSIRLVLWFLNASQVDDASGAAPMNGARYRSFLVIVACLAGYFVCNLLAGFLISTILFVTFLMRLLGNRNYLQNVLFALLISFGISAIFKWVLVLPLPSGSLLYF